MVAAEERSSVRFTILVAGLLCGAYVVAPASAMAQQRPASAPRDTKTPKTTTPKTTPAPAQQASPGKAAPTGRAKALKEPARGAGPNIQQTAPAPAPPTQPKLAPLPPVDASAPPPSLPRAPRERMRACAEEWTAFKQKTKSALPMWREFATGCLTRRSDAKGRKAQEPSRSP